MRGIDGLARQVATIQRSVKARYPWPENILLDPDWPVMRDCILGALAPYPDALAAMNEIIISAQQSGSASYLWLRERVFTTLENYPDARLAVARALMALKKERDGKQ
jgi:hypothetical protein